MSIILITIFYFSKYKSYQWKIVVKQKYVAYPFKFPKHKNSEELEVASHCTTMHYIPSLQGLHHLALFV